jgi:hypothetical protein
MNLYGDKMKKAICIISSFIAIMVSIYYMHIGGLFGNASAFSKVGLSHPILFTAWGIVTYFALSFNIYTAYSATKYRFYIPMIIISGIGMILTLCCDFDYSKYTEYILHCIGSLSFSSITGICVFILFLLRKKYILSGICATILICDLILLLIFKETALIEITPIFAGYIMLLFINLKREDELIEA